MGLLLLAGCVSPATPPTATPASCPGALSQHTLFLAGAGDLVAQRPEAGSAPGNGFSGAFLDNRLQEWRSQPAPEGFTVQGNVTLEYWVRFNGSPAPVASGGPTGKAYQFFNQFGSSR